MDIAKLFPKIRCPLIISHFTPTAYGRVRHTSNSTIYTYGRESRSHISTTLECFATFLTLSCGPIRIQFSFYRLHVTTLWPCYFFLGFFVEDLRLKSLLSFFNSILLMFFIVEVMRDMKNSGVFFNSVLLLFAWFESIMNFFS